MFKFVFPTKRPESYQAQQISEHALRIVVDVKR
jgi:hypothetical protein